MTQAAQNGQELLKQNFELTLIIIFIGLAFGLVGLVVPTAAVMGVVVISIGVIVGFVSYRDAFVPKVPAQIPTQISGSTPVAPKLPTRMTVAAPVTQKPPASPPGPKLEQKPAPQPIQKEEALPRLPKIQRLPESGGATFPPQIKPANVTLPQASSPSTVEPLQARSIKSTRKPRARKTVEVPSFDEEKSS